MFEKGDEQEGSLLAPIISHLDEEVKNSKVFEFKPTFEFIFDPSVKVNVENSPFNVGALTPIASKVRLTDTTNLSQS
jgi:hypothetical protein